MLTMATFESERLFGVVLFGIAGCFLPDFEEAGRPCPCADGWTCDAATNTCVRGSNGGGSAQGGAGAGAGTSSGGAAAGGAAVGGGSAGGGGAGSLATPLTLTGTIGGGALAISAAGRFTLESEAAARWHLARWYDLATDPEELDDLAAKIVPNQQVYANSLHTLWVKPAAEWTSLESGVVTNATIVDDTPVRVTLTADLDPDPAVSTEVHVRFRHNVYASGHVSVETTLSASQPALVASAIEAFYTSARVEKMWTATDSGSDATFLQRLDGPSPHPNLLLLNHDTPGSREVDNGANRYWASFDLPLATPMVARGSYWIWPGGMSLSEMASRADDLRVPAATVVGGAGAMTYDYSLGAYTADVDANASLVSFRVGGDRVRYAPAFELHGWTSPTYTIRLDGAVLATNSAPIGEQTLAHYNAAGSYLVFQYLADLPVASPNGEAVFTVSP